MQFLMFYELLMKQMKQMKLPPENEKVLNNIFFSKINILLDIYSEKY